MSPAQQLWMGVLHACTYQILMPMLLDMMISHWVVGYGTLSLYEVFWPLCVVELKLGSALAASRHRNAFPLGLVTGMKLLHISMTRQSLTILLIAVFEVTLTLLWIAFLMCMPIILGEFGTSCFPLPCNTNMLSKLPIYEKNSRNSLCVNLVSLCLAFLPASLSGPCKK